MPIVDLLINLLASTIYDKTTTLHNKSRFQRFKNKERRWIEKFCNNNDGTILTSASFATFLENQNPIESLYMLVLDPEYSDLSDVEFVKNIITKFKISIEPEQQLGVIDNNLIQELFLKLIKHLKKYLDKFLTEKDRYLIYVMKQGNNRTINVLSNQFQEQINEIAKTGKISDKKAESFYQVINKALIDGQIETIYKLIPLIENKNNDLENSVKLNIEVLSVYHVLKQDILDVYSIIDNSNIKDDLCRKLILKYIDDSTFLTSLKAKTNNNTLKQIIDKLIEKECFYKEEVTVKNHVKFYNISVLQDFKCEQWLVNRICVIDIKKNKINDISSICELLETDKTFVDDLLILEAKHLKILREYSENKEKLSRFSEKLKSLEYIYMHSSKEIKTKYYEILIRILSIYSETEALQLINELPSEISDDIIISSFEMSIKINNHNVTEEEVIDFCHKTGQYLLMNDYINAHQFDNVKIKKLLDENKIFIRKDLSLFILYVQAIRKIDGNSEVQKIKECYKKKYGNYLEYYLVTLDDSNEESFKNTLNDVVNMWYSDQLLCYYYDSEVKFVQILLNNSKFSEGLDVIKKLETIGLTNPLITKYKAKILIKQQKFIDALTLLSSNFDMYKEDTEIIDSILVISFHNAREVLDDVIESALKIRTPRLLMLVSNILVSKSKFSEARTLITEALLKSPNATEICEQYLMIHTQDPSKEIPMVKGVQVDTTLYLSCGTTHLVYCIHKNGFLANEPYFWENSIHISEDTCICMNLLNKKIGDKINMNDLEYTIDEIIPTEVYLSRLCIEMMIKKGTAKAFHADIKEDEFCNIEEFKSWIKENIGTNNILNEFIEKYNDLSQTPLPLYLIHKASQLTYSELIIAFLEDKNIIFRESVHNDCGSGNGYMLTAAAVIVLYKLGVNIGFLNENNVYIPNSIATQIEQDVEKIITSNKREHKSRMFFINNDIYTDEASDEEKQKNLVQSVNLKKYVNKLKTINNNSDIVLDGNNAITCREGLGICDCDSISISMKENYKLVCAEAAVIGLASYFKLNSSCIIDFLCEIKTPLLDLIHYMKKMIDYKFFITVTPYSFDYILNNFCSLNQEEQQLFLQKLDEYFTNIQSQDEKYKQSCTLIFNDAIRTHINNNGEIAHTPLSEIMIPHMLILNKLEIELQISENGDIKTMFYRTNSKSSAKSDS